MKYKFFLFSLLCFGAGITLLSAQEYTRQDTLRGSLNPLRTCYDVVFYDLNLRVRPDEQFITGYNEIHYEAQADFKRMQIDLFERMQIAKIEQAGKELQFEREGNATFVELAQVQQKGEVNSIKVYYYGKPRRAIRAPWDGGFSWEKDEQGRDWIGVSCEGLGASVWWPNKDHLSEEPDSMRIACEVPSELMCVANGNLREEKKLDDNYTRYTWFVSYPINNYNVSLNIGHYTHFSDTYQSQDGETLALDYYVLDYNLGKAKKQFEQVKPMLNCYEKLFGKYPFWKDGFALVETPYLGMEHQGAIAYGNQYKPGYLGSDLSGTGIGLRFDYIIIHEAGHEYWGNSVSCRDHAELWIHESFCTYTEALYVECLYGKAKAYQYVTGQQRSIGNRSPIVGPLGVNAEGSSDMYFKGANMLHTLRNVINDDQQWFELIKGIAQKFEIKNTNTQEIVAYINQKTGEDYTYFFEQYLYHPAVPVLEYKIQGVGDKRYELSYRWRADVEDFRMPVRVAVGAGKFQEIQPRTEWQNTQLSLPGKKLEFPENAYYFQTEKK